MVLEHNQCFQLVKSLCLVLLQVKNLSVPNLLSLTDCVGIILIKRVHSVHVQNENEVRNVKDIKLPQKVEEFKQESAKQIVKEYIDVFSEM